MYDSEKLVMELERQFEKEEFFVAIKSVNRDKALGFNRYSSLG